jgi:PPIC-type PPIASE domain
VNRRPVPDSVTRLAGVCAVSVCALITLSSCTTFNRNNLAAEVGDRSLTAKQAETLASAGGAPATGDQLRTEITKWIRVSVLEAARGLTAPAALSTSADLDARLAIASVAGDRAKELYEAGIGSTPLVCLAAITSTSLDDANKVLASLKTGAKFADLAHQFSTDTVIAAAGGIVKSQDGTQECVVPSAISTVVIDALKGAPVGTPIVANLGTFSAVLMLRPYDDLLPASQALIAKASIPVEQLQVVVNAAKIYVDPRYGRWDPESSTVVTLTS